MSEHRKEPWKCKKGDRVKFTLSHKSKTVFEGIVENRIGTKLVQISLSSNGRTFTVSIPCIKEIVAVPKELAISGPFGPCKTTIPA